MSKVAANASKELVKAKGLKETFEALGIDAKSLQDIYFERDLKKNSAETQRLIKLLNSIHARASFEEVVYNAQLGKESTDDKAAREGFLNTSHFNYLCLQHAKQSKTKALQYKFAGLRDLPSNLLVSAITNVFDEFFVLQGYDYFDSTDPRCKTLSEAGFNAIKGNEVSKILAAQNPDSVAAKMRNAIPSTLSPGDMQISTEEQAKSQYFMTEVTKTLLTCLRLFRMIPRLQSLGLLVIYNTYPDLIKQYFDPKESFAYIKSLINEKNLAGVVNEYSTIERESYAFIRTFITDKNVDPEFYELYSHAQLLLSKLNHFLINAPEDLEACLFALSRETWLDGGVQAIINAFGGYISNKMKLIPKSKEPELKQLYENQQNKNKWVYDDLSIRDIQNVMSIAAKTYSENIHSIQYSYFSIKHAPNYKNIDELAFEVKVRDLIDLSMNLSGILPWFNPNLYLECIQRNVNIAILGMKTRNIHIIQEEHQLQQTLKLSMVDALIAAGKNKVNQSGAQSVAQAKSAVFYPSPMAMAGVFATGANTNPMAKAQPKAVAASQNAVQQPDNPEARALKESEETERKRKVDLMAAMYKQVQQNAYIKSKGDKEQTEKLITSVVEKPNDFPRQKDELHKIIADIAVDIGILKKLDKTATKADAVAPFMVSPSPWDSSNQSTSPMTGRISPKLADAVGVSGSVNATKPTVANTNDNSSAKPEKPMEKPQTKPSLSTEKLMDNFNKYAPVILENSEMDSRLNMSALNFSKITNLNDEALTGILSVLQANLMPEIEILNFSNVNLSLPRIQILIECLLSNKNIAVLDLQFTGLTDVTGRELLNFFNKHLDKIPLESLLVSNNLSLPGKLGISLVERVSRKTPNAADSVRPNSPIDPSEQEMNLPDFASNKSHAGGTARAETFAMTEDEALAMALSASEAEQKKQANNRDSKSEKDNKTSEAAPAITAKGAAGDAAKATSPVPFNIAPKPAGSVYAAVPAAGAVAAEWPAAAAAAHSSVGTSRKPVPTATKEQEDLALALALSVSEAEQKAKQGNDSADVKTASDRKTSEAVIPAVTTKGTAGLAAAASAMATQANVGAADAARPSFPIAKPSSSTDHLQTMRTAFLDGMQAVCTGSNGNGRIHATDNAATNKLTTEALAGSDQKQTFDNLAGFVVTGPSTNATPQNVSSIAWTSTEQHFPAAEAQSTSPGVADMSEDSLAADALDLLSQNQITEELNFGKTMFADFSSGNMGAWEPVLSAPESTTTGAVMSATTPSAKAKPSAKKR